MVRRSVRKKIAATRKALNWESEAFVVPSDVLDAWRLAGRSLRQDRTRNGTHPPRQGRSREKGGVRAPLCRRTRKRSRFEAIAAYKKKLAETKPNARDPQGLRRMRWKCINGVIAETIGGSADLTGSNNTKTSQTKSITPTDFSGRYIHYGVREHGMAAAMNGMALHGGLIPYSGGFLIFSDYCRPSIRLAALMGIRVIHVLTHDSIGLGEDGPDAPAG
jgi:transketolase